MKSILILLFTVVPAFGVRYYDGLRVKYGWSDALADREYFYRLPMTLMNAETIGWTRYERPPGPMQELRMYCPPGRGVCPLYATSGFIAGLMIALPEEEFESLAISPEKKFVKWSAQDIPGEPGRDYWTLTQYFVSEESLKAGAGPTPGNGATLQDGGVWITTGPGGKLLQIPTNETQLVRTTAFKKQNCVPNMGTHYYYNMTPSLNCEDLLPWFALTSQGELVGTGFQMFGRLPRQKQQEWVERPFAPKESAKLTIPFGPPCLYEWAASYGVVSLHIYYVDRPWKIRCEDGASAKPAGLKERTMLAGIRYASKILDEFKKVFPW